jgi:hypothetical protein
MKKSEIKRISNRVDAIQRQFNGWTIKKKVDGKIFRRSPEEQRRMFEQIEKTSLELSNIDSELRLEQLRLFESKPEPNYAMVQEENPELWELLMRIDKLENAIDELVEPINIHLSIRGGIDRLINEFVEEIKNTAIDIANNCGNDPLQEVKDINELTLELKRWQQDIANDYCVRNRDIGSLLFEKRNGVYIRDMEPQSDTRPGVDPNIFNLDAETIQELQPIQRVYPNNIEFDLEIPQQLQSIPVTELDPNIFKSNAEIPQEQ